MKHPTYLSDDFQYLPVHMRADRAIVMAAVIHALKTGRPDAAYDKVLQYAPSLRDDPAILKKASTKSRRYKIK